MKGDNKKLQYRINEQIRVREVRIVGDEIESVVMPTRQAQQLAEEKNVISSRFLPMPLLRFAD